MRLLSKHGYQYIRLEIVCQQANYEPEYEEIYHHFSFPSISQRMSWSVKYAFLFWRKSFSALSGFIRRWIIVLWPQSSVTHLKMNFSCIFWVMLGRWCQRLQPPAGRACFRADRSQKKAAKYHGLVAGAEVTLLSRTSLFSFLGHKNWLFSWKNQRNPFNSSDESFIARYYLQ